MGWGPGRIHDHAVFFIAAGPHPNPPPAGEGVNATLQRPHRLRLVPRQHLGHHLAGLGAHAQAARHGLGCTAVVARDHHRAHTARVQALDGRARAGLGLVAKGQQGHGAQRRMVVFARRRIVVFARRRSVLFAWRLIIGSTYGNY